MKVKELKSLSQQELQNKLIELKKELMKINASVSTPKSPGKIRYIRKTIARIITLIDKKKEVSK